MDRREIEQLLRAIREARAAAEPAALATVVRVRGSAYRREGTQMFVRRDLTYECSLSGGCLEPTVADAAAGVIATGEPAFVSYDLADDSVWGLGIGCSGAVDVRIERLEDDPLTNEWLRVLERGEAGVLITPLAGPTGRLILSAAGTVLGSLSDAAVQRAAIAHAHRQLSADHPQSSAELIGAAELFFHVTLPPPEVVVFGAGYDAGPLAQLAWTLGFAVTIVDARQTFLRSDRFPGAALVAAHFSQFAEKVVIRPGSFVLIMNHHVERDRESLRFALASDARSIGVLGPRSRYQKLLADLRRDGDLDSAAMARVRSPVGLALGAETPAEVAVSIVGEWLAIRRGFDAGFLTGSARSLHRPDGNRILARS